MLTLEMVNFIHFLISFLFYFFVVVVTDGNSHGQMLLTHLLMLCMLADVNGPVYFIH